MDFAIQSDFAIITGAGSRIIPDILMLKDDSRSYLLTIRSDFPELRGSDVS